MCLVPIFPAKPSASSKRKKRRSTANTEGLLWQVADEVKEPVKKTLFEHEDQNIFGTHEISRWYLKETEFSEADAAEFAKEDSTAKKVEVFIANNWSQGQVLYFDILKSIGNLDPGVIQGRKYGSRHPHRLLRRTR